MVKPVDGIQTFSLIAKAVLSPVMYPFGNKVSTIFPNYTEQNVHLPLDAERLLSVCCLIKVFMDGFVHTKSHYIFCGSQIRSMQTFVGIWALVGYEAV